MAAAQRLRDDPAPPGTHRGAVEALVDRTWPSTSASDVDASSPARSRAGTPSATADQLELLLGPDLQYIRINGAVVGGLAGLVLHTVAQTIG